MYEGKLIGHCDNTDIYITVSGDRIRLLSVNTLDYSYMQEYIDNNTDRYQEWKDAVADGGCEDGYETFRDNYEYNYESWFDYNSEADIYYDSNDSDTETYTFDPSRYASPVRMLDTIINDFNNLYGNPEYTDWRNEWILRATLVEWVNSVYEYEKERNTQHYNVYKYYK